MVKVQAWEVRSSDVPHSAGMTVRQALVAAGVANPSSSATVKVNGKKKGLEDTVGANDTVVYTPNVSNG